MSIEKLLCLSTANISSDTYVALGIKSGDKNDWRNKLPIHRLDERGFLICIAGDVASDEEARQAVPEDLLDVIVYADDNGCEWILFDEEADVITALPFFDEAR